MLPLCYFDRSLDSKLGSCSHNLSLYLNSDEITKSLQRINDNLITCKKCEPIDFLSNTNFGSFDVKTASKMPLSLEVRKPKTFSIITINLIVLFIMVILAAWTWRRTNHILEKYISVPLKKITNKLKSGNTIGKNDEIEELAYLIDEIQDRENKLSLAKKNENLIAIGKMVTRLAHDIRSPLLAIIAIVKQTQFIPEKERIILRNASQTINEIANNLLSKHRNELVNNLLINDEANEIQSEYISVLLDSIISEKKVQYEHLPISIEYHIEANAYCLFANVMATDFRRAISNLINNAVEAILGNGKVKIDLSTDSKSVIIKITDSGIGMKPELIHKILKGETVSCKKSGIGIGLSSAIQFINSWGGILDILSELNVGTTISINLPIQPPAYWFAQELTIEANSAIVIVDDDQSVHDAWQLRFDYELMNSNLRLIHLYQPDDLMNFVSSDPKSVFYLCDYEFVGHEINGLDLIDKLHLNKIAFLVTSLADDCAIRLRCSGMGLSILPKNFVPHIPINILSPSQTNSIQPELILIDNDKFVTDAWEFSAKSKKKHIVIFNNINDFNREIDKFDRQIPIYIDSDLGLSMSGEQYAKKIYEKGFKNIYLTTGYKPSSFRSMYWIKEIIGKDSIFV